MQLTTTAVGFFLVFLGLSFCGFRFFRASQKIDSIGSMSRVGILLSLLFFVSALQNGALAVTSLSFINRELSYIFLLIGHCIISIGTDLAIYSFFYIFRPLTSPWLAVIGSSILGMAVVLSTILVHPQPFADSGGGVDWNMPNWLEVLVCYLLFLDLGALAAIFGYTFLCAKSREVKNISFFIILLAGGGIVNVFTRFLLAADSNTPLYSQIFGTVLMVLGLMITIIFLPLQNVMSLISRMQSTLFNRQKKYLLGKNKNKKDF